VYDAERTAGLGSSGIGIGIAEYGPVQDHTHVETKISWVLVIQGRIFVSEIPEIGRQFVLHGPGTDK
jgi:hypothetical protein